MKIAYLDQKFTARSMRMIELSNAIITLYQNQGFDLTLRQLYYQLVSRDIIPNRSNEYDKLGALISNARYAGLVDWDAIVDRTRYVRENSHWKTAEDIIDSAASSYRLDRWSKEWGQIVVPEVWIEKDALIGVIEGVCQRLDVPHFSCRGYTSSSELWSAAMRMVNRWRRDRQRTVILHFGDHDPSGIDMSRDIDDRLMTFCSKHGCPTPQVERIALNLDQVRQYDPPPNPAKVTDSRFQAYVDQYDTDESWELDALEPTVIGDLIEANVLQYRDEDGWAASGAEQTKRRALLAAAASNWERLTEVMENEGIYQNGAEADADDSADA